MVSERVEARHTTADRRCKRHAAHRERSLRKESADTPHRYTGDVRIERIVVDKVVPQYRTAGLYPAPHSVRQRFLKLWVQQRGEDRGLIDDVEAAVVENEIHNIAGVDGTCSGQIATRDRNPLRQQLAADQVAGTEAEANQLQQVAARAATDFEQPQGLQGRIGI